MSQGTKLVLSPMGKAAVILGSAAVGMFIVSVLETEDGYAAVTKGVRAAAGSEATRQLGHQVVDAFLERVTRTETGPLGS